ncbi:MAG: hypothetical protein KDA78_14995, partial [Planctomycetaceae bacterium]|nr:hypothetical protein [Planctomycetaceae bacterium]
MKRQLLGNHQNSWIWGTKAIAETIASGHWKILELHLLENSSAPHLMEWEAWAHRHRIPCERETAARLEQLCKARDHQGAIALMGPFPYTPFPQLREGVEKGSRILVLDGVQDPFNLGAIIRSAVAFGFDGILCSTHNQVGVTSHVARSSVGLVNRIAICRVEDLSASVQELKRCGVQLLTTHQQGVCDVDQLSTNQA